MRIVELMLISVLSINGLAAMDGQPQDSAAQTSASQAEKTNSAPLGSEDNPVRVSSGLMLQRRLHSVNPIIPPEDFAGESGGVVASATIDRDGKVVKLKALSGPEKRRRYCLDAFKKWTFKPYLLNGEPVFVQTTFTVDF